MIKRFRRGEHPGQFVGYRIVVGVDGRKVQEYFAASEYGGLLKAGRAARKRHDQLVEQREAARLRRYGPDTPVRAAARAYMRQRRRAGLA